MAKETLTNILEYIPTYTYPIALSNLISEKREMDTVKKDGYDNYAHRLGMCENAQMGKLGAVASLWFGLLKEGKDITEKTFGINGKKKIGFSEALKDSKKDMENNFEGIYYGLTNPEKSCRIWLKDLDYKNNRWRNYGESL